MILSDITIKNMIENGELIENPIDIEKCIQPASYDIHIGNQFVKPVYNRKNFPKKTSPDTIFVKIDKSECIDLKMEIKYDKLETFFEDDGGEFVIVPPKSFILAVTKEIIKLPNNISAFVEGRSSIGRSGLFIQNAGWIDSGFRGTITLELFNASEYSMKLYSDMRIGQIIFCKNDEDSMNPYKGKYQDQIDVTGSEIHKDFL